MVLLPIFLIVVSPTEISSTLTGLVVIPSIYISPAIIDPIVDEPTLLILILSPILIVVTSSTYSVVSDEEISIYSDTAFAVIMFMLFTDIPPWTSPSI